MFIVVPIRHLLHPEVVARDGVGVARVYSTIGVI